MLNKEILCRTRAAQLYILSISFLLQLLVYRIELLVCLYKECFVLRILDKIR